MGDSTQRPRVAAPIGVSTAVKPPKVAANGKTEAAEEIEAKDEGDGDVESTSGGK